MAKNKKKLIWNLKHSEIELTSDRRSIIVRYKNNSNYQSSIWNPIEFYGEERDNKGALTGKTNKYTTVGSHFITIDGQDVGCYSYKNFMRIRYWVNHTARLSKIYGYFSDIVPTYVLQSLDCFLEKEIDWKPEDYNLSNDPIPENFDDLVKVYN